MALPIRVISGPVSGISPNMCGSHRLSPSLLLSVDFLILFPPAVRLFVSARQGSLRFSLSDQGQLSDTPALPKPDSLKRRASYQGKEIPYVCVGFNVWAPSRLSGVRNRAFSLDENPSDIKFLHQNFPLPIPQDTAALLSLIEVGLIFQTRR